MEILLLFLLGLVIGSFLNVLVYRLNTEDKVPKFWQGRSLCPKCKHELSWEDNIPLFSFIMLLGRCRYCRQPISWQYPIVELVTAICFVFVGLNPLLLALAAVFIVIFFSDWIFGLIPDEMIIVGSVVALFLRPNFLVGTVSALIFLTIVLATKFRGMGLGDVKLAFLMGLLLGWPKSLVAFWAAFILGGVVAISLLLLKRTKFSATIPLGPFLVIGILISALWSTQLLHLLGL